VPSSAIVMGSGTVVGAVAKSARRRRVEVAVQLSLWPQGGRDACATVSANASDGASKPLALRSAQVSDRHVIQGRAAGEADIIADQRAVVAAGEIEHVSNAGRYRPPPSLLNHTT
jgi:hypothetical protein